MPFAITIDRASVLSAQRAFGRLRLSLRQHPIVMDDVLARARECGRCAYDADMRLDMMIQVLAGLPLQDSYCTPALPEAMTDAAVEAYLVATDTSVEYAAR